MAIGGVQKLMSFEFIGLKSLTDELKPSAPDYSHNVWLASVQTWSEGPSREVKEANWGLIDVGVLKGTPFLTEWPSTSTMIIENGIDEVNQIISESNSKTIMYWVLPHCGGEKLFSLQWIAFNIELLRPDCNHGFMTGWCTAEDNKMCLTHGNLEHVRLFYQCTN